MTTSCLSEFCSTGMLCVTPRSQIHVGNTDSVVANEMTWGQANRGQMILYFS